MMLTRTVVLALLLAGTVACQQDVLAPHYYRKDAQQPGAPAQQGPTGPVAVKTASVGAFVPPDLDAIPEGGFGDLVRKGHDIFTDTPTHAAQFVGNGLRCSNCHLDAGRLEDSAPLWGAWVRYPAYRSKTQSVNSYSERLQGCFMYSMDGKAPPLGHEVLMALEAYSFWMADGAPTGKTIPGAGYPKTKQAPQAPDFERGSKVYATNCAICHGEDGLGQKVEGRYVFPPLWGPDSFNWGAGMHQLDNAAAFIRANMPLGRGGTLSEQEAWDVAFFMNAHERPQDPRFTGDVAETRRRFHDDPNSPYGTMVNGHLLGSTPSSR
ncbi:MAG: c-type cytochrome [Steroidobacteraceae bacterium]|nr:c-type cytochrome [Steroidobacteraceae bacterium]